MHVELEAPLSHTFLVEKLLAHILDSFDLFFRLNSSLCQHVTHSLALLDIIRDTIDKAEFRREEEGVITSLNLEERLLGLLDFHVVLGQEVVSDRSLFALVLELSLDRVGSENNIVDDVSSLVAPVGNDGVTTVLKLDQLFPTVLGGRVLPDLVDLLEAGASGHELENTVHADHSSKSTLDNRSFEATPNLHSMLLELDRSRGVEEPRGFADLLEVGLSKSLLDDDV
jgi:hypothetical protein